MTVEIKQLIGDTGHTLTFAAKISFSRRRLRVLEDMGLVGGRLEAFLQIAMNDAVDEYEYTHLAQRCTRAREISRKIDELKARTATLYDELGRVGADYD